MKGQYAISLYFHKHSLHLLMWLCVFGGLLLLLECFMMLFMMNVVMNVLMYVVIDLVTDLVMLVMMMLVINKHTGANHQQ